MDRGLFSGLVRPMSVSGRSKPMPLIAKGVGGSASSIAPKPIKKTSKPPSSRVFQRQR
jgi:hypothetical protein